MKKYALYIGIIIYSLLSSPTPDTFAWPEYIVSILFIGSVGIIGGWNAITQKDIPLNLSYHRLFLLYMISAPLIVGVMYGNNLSDILRDVIPVLCLILPLAFYKIKTQHLSTILTIAGGLFALRYIVPFLPISNIIPNEIPLLYLANSPLVPLSAIIGFSWVIDKQKILISKRLIGLLICVICFAAMAAMIQRAPLILTSASCLILLGIYTSHKPLKSMIIGTGLVILLLPVFPFFIELSDSIILKTMSVGFNNRIDEFTATLNEISIFGHGWGYLWQSPAVGYEWVRFTHNMFGYYWLKTGAIGAMLSIGFIYLWGKTTIKTIKIQPAIGLAIITPLIIHIFLYTGFKTLDFALILTLLASCNTKQNQS